MGWAEPLRGGCYCGALRFEIRSVFDCLWCHCGDCRKTTGAPATVSVVVRSDDFAVVAGMPVSHPRPHGAQRFCGQCGGGWHYAWTASMGDLTSIGVGALDDPEAVRPRAHQFDAHRVEWLGLTMGCPGFQTASSRIPIVVPDRSPLHAAGRRT